MEVRFGAIATEKGRKLNRYRRLILFLSGLMLGFLNPLQSQGASKVQFCITYTNDVMGEVEPCG